MARKPRIHIPGGVYHVMLRGNGGEEIFFSDEDYCRLYLLLQEGATRFRYRVHQEKGSGFQVDKFNWLSIMAPWHANHAYISPVAFIM
jgi:transcriptional regulator of nitric oxide reductase